MAEWIFEAGSHVVLGTTYRKAKIVGPDGVGRNYMMVKLEEVGIGFVTGNPRVGKCHTVPVPAVTAPVTGAGTHRTRLATV